MQALSFAKTELSHPPLLVKLAGLVVGRTTTRPASFTRRGGLVVGRTTYMIVLNLVLAFKIADVKNRELFNEMTDVALDRDG